MSGLSVPVQRQTWTNNDRRLDRDWNQTDRRRYHDSRRTDRRDDRHRHTSVDRHVQHDRYRYRDTRENYSRNRDERDRYRRCSRDGRLRDHGISSGGGRGSSSRSNVYDGGGSRFDTGRGGNGRHDYGRCGYGRHDCGRGSNGRKDGDKGDGGGHGEKGGGERARCDVLKPEAKTTDTTMPKIPEAVHFPELWSTHMTDGDHAQLKQWEFESRDQQTEGCSTVQSKNVSDIQVHGTESRKRPLYEDTSTDDDEPPRKRSVMYVNKHHMAFDYLNRTDSRPGHGHYYY